MKVVADTNTLISGFLWNGAPAQLLNAALDSRLTIFSSKSLLDEFEATLSAPKFLSRLDAKGLTASGLVTKFRNSCHEVTPSLVDLPSNLRDADDLAVLACAIAVPVDLIVSGDKDLLVLGQFRGIPIVDSRAALELMRLD
ncbi:MAG: putative toxin-antitoxin system toxin component, PIN family [Spartobacteria bacterium]